MYGRHIMKYCKKELSIFQEAIDHCRWKRVLYNVLSNIHISEYKNNTTFEEIFIKTYNICKEVKGLGLLTIYDTTSSICREYSIHIDNVYIIGNGPKRAVALLDIKTKTQILDKNIRLRYTTIPEIIHAFALYSYKIDKSIKNTKNGDIMESYLCNWQKGIK